MFKIISIIILLHFTTEIFSQKTNDSVLYWNDARHLRCKDFKGAIPDSATYSARSAIMISTNGYWNKGLPDYKVINKFYPYKAWKKDTLSDNLLQHEQIHFDIAEISARKIRKEITELRQAGEEEPSIYKQHINKLLDDYYARDTEYDKETQHGLNDKKQQEWNKKTAKELEELEEYDVDYKESGKR